jgi:KRAB domain-containing zinc finger protein
MDPDPLSDVIVKAEEGFPLDHRIEQDEDILWNNTQPDDYGDDPTNNFSGVVEPNKQEDSNLYTSFPVYEYIMHQSKLQFKDPNSATNECVHTKRVNVLLSSLDMLIKDIKHLVESSCSVYSNEDMKPLDSNLELEQNYINVTDSISLILGISGNLTKLCVSDINRLETEYTRCSSVINAVIQMIDFKETDDSTLIECPPNLPTYINEDDPLEQEYETKYAIESDYYNSCNEKPKTKKVKKTRTKSQTTSKNPTKFNVPDKLKSASNEVIGRYIRKKFIEKPPKINRQLGYDPEFCITESEYNELLQNGSPFSCTRCQRVFVERRSLENHLIGLCVGKAFEWKDLQPNFKEENEMFHCLFPGCTAMVKPSGGKNGRTAPIYRHHQEVHLVGVECPYKCKAPGCGMTFFMKGLLGEHTRDTHQKVRFCDICGKGISAFQLGIHMRRHTGEKPHKCSYCDYRAVEKGIVNKHIKEVHAMEKHFCDLCGKNYKSKNSLRDHLKTHSEVPPFQCKECGRGFKHRQNLRRHLAVIHKLKHTCNICKVGEFSASELREHRQKVHNMELIAFAVSKRSYEAKLDKPVTS